MTFLELVKEFNEMGCTDEVLCSIASRVYIDLENVVKATDLEKHFDNDLNFIYIVGKLNNKSNSYLPVPSTTDIDFLRIGKIQNKISAPEKRIILSICDPNSTILYYEIKSGWIDN